MIENYPIIGCEACAVLLNVSFSAISDKTTRMGLKINISRKKINASKRAKNYWETVPSSARKVDANNFINCSTKEAAYILGILWADGNLNNKSQHYKTCIELISKDFDDIKNIFLITGKWGFSTRCRKNKNSQTTASACQIPLYVFLQENDYETKSISSADKILSRIPNELKSYWWRGYFDGDGCFYFNRKNSCRQASFAGSYEQNWNFLEILLKKLDIKYNISRRIQGKNKHSVVRITSKNDIMKFGSYIYNTQDEFFGLIRKKEKFLQIIN